MVKEEVVVVMDRPEVVVLLTRLAEATMVVLLLLHTDLLVTVMVPHHLVERKHELSFALWTRD